MKLELSESQQLVQDVFGKMFRQESTPARIRAAEKTGFDRLLWKELLESGAIAMRVAEPLGGAASLADAAVLASEAGRYLVSAPLIEAMVTARLLSGLKADAGDELLAKLCSGEMLVTVALHDASDQKTQLVPGAAVADAILWIQNDHLVARAGISQRQARYMGSLTHSSVDPNSGRAIELGRGERIRELYEAAIAEWKILMACCLTGASQEALRLAAHYAQERQAFGKPIGSFQGVAHPLADSATEIDGAQLLSRRAIATLSGRGASQLPPHGLVALNYWFATQASSRAVTRAIRVFGGYGMTLEYDIQLYFRRVRGWALTAGDPAQELIAAGNYVWGGSKRAVPDPGEDETDFRWGEKAESLGREATQFFAQNDTEDLADFAYVSQDAHHPKLFQELAASRLLYPAWPDTLHGRACSMSEAAAVQEASIAAGLPILVPVVTDMVGRMLMEFGSEAAKSEILPQLASGAAYCSLGYSEPSGGSDVFAVKSRAVREGQDWILNGQKMFTTQGHLADYALMLVRTDPAAKKHAGLTLFVVPLRQDGYEAQNVDTIGDERTNITYYADMLIPDRYRLGEINGGASVMSAALKLEQGVGLYNVGPLRRLLHHALAWARADHDNDAPIQDPDVRARLARVACSIEIADSLTRRSIWAAENGCSEKWYGSMSKLFGSEAWLAASTDLAELAAPDSLLCAPTAAGWIEIEYRRSLPSTIYGGTSEIHRSIIAESALQMPRSRT